MINPELLSRFVSPSSMWCKLPVTAIDCELNKINHTLTHFELKRDEMMDGCSSSHWILDRMTVRPQLGSIYTFNCLEIYFFQLRSGDEMVVKNLAAFLAQILSFPLLFQIKLWLFESRFCWGVRQDSSDTGNVESTHAAAWSFS